MNKGIRVIICIIAVVLIQIAEKGIPIKLSISDCLIYGITLCIFISMADAW